MRVAQLGRRRPAGPRPARQRHKARTPQGQNQRARTSRAGQARSGWLRRLACSRQLLLGLRRWRLGATDDSDCSPRWPLMIASRSASTSSRSAIVRRSMSMSQWLRGGLAFEADGSSPVAVTAVAPQTRHSHFAGTSASAANGTLNRGPSGSRKRPPGAGPGRCYGRSRSSWRQGECHVVRVRP